LSPSSARKTRPKVVKSNFKSIKFLPSKFKLEGSTRNGMLECWNNGIMGLKKWADGLTADFVLTNKI
jgi:hypothetical protein